MDHSTPDLSSSQRLKERQARERSARNQARDDQRAAEAALERCIQEEAQAAQQDEDDAEEANLIAQEAKEQAELNAKSIARRDASARKRLQRKNDIANLTAGTSHHEAAIDDSVMRGPPVLDREITMDLNPGAARPERVDHPSTPAKQKPEATPSHPPAPQFTTAS
jgi:outer membrane translocation and assembly module TamA